MQNSVLTREDIDKAVIDFRNFLQYENDLVQAIYDKGLESRTLSNLYTMFGPNRVVVFIQSVNGDSEIICKDSKYEALKELNHIHKLIDTSIENKLRRNRDLFEVKLSEDILALGFKRNRLSSLVTVQNPDNTTSFISTGGLNDNDYYVSDSKLESLRALQRGIALKVYLGRY